MKKYFIFLLTTILLNVSCVKQEQSGKEVTNKIPVSVSKSIEKKYTPVLTFSGTAYANREANLGTAIPGRVEKIYFDEGQKVNKGNKIVELSSELYVQALIERNTLKKDFDRVSRLKEKGSLSQQDYDHVKAKYDASVAKTEMMKKNSEIRAPFSGVIVDHIVNEGENFLFAPSLKPGYSMTSGIVKLMQLEILNVEIDINEKDISKIHAGQDAKIVFDAYPDKIYHGKVQMIDPVLSTLSRTAKAKIQIKNKDLTIKPGMYANVSIKLPENQAVFVPNESIYRQPGTGNDFVFVIKNNVAYKTKIERLYTVEDVVAVKGLEANKTIVVAGKGKLSDEMEVEIKEK
ncbi:MAG: efflux RND transporter periplasmic adaptor subunit [Bacteroidetes bacterium]|nr:efflux RND transporter periplasmic adaptor subunit [Bacteroidota bacterium]